MEMLPFIDPLFSPLVFGLLIFGAASRYGYFIDEKIDSESRNHLSRIMNQTADRKNWSSLFVSMFDRLFDPSARGRPRFVRSTIASSIVFMILVLMWTILYWDSVLELLSKSVEMNVEWILVLIFLIHFFLSIMVNVVGDYFSLWESRWIIGRLDAVQGIVQRGILMIVDLVATIIIYCVILSVGVCIVFLVLSKFDASFTEIGQATLKTIRAVFVGGLNFSHYNLTYHYLGICFYTTLFTSLWVWTFSLGTMVWPILGGLSKFFNANDKPVGAAMTIGGAFVGCSIIAVGYGCMLL